MCVLGVIYCEKEGEIILRVECIVWLDLCLTEVVSMREKNLQIDC